MKAKSWVLLFAAVVLLAIVIVGIGAWREARETAVFGCFASIHKGITMLKRDEVPLRDVSPKWKVLDGADGARLIDAAARVNPLDCSRVSGGEPFLDYWGRPLRVAVRRAGPGEFLEVRIWSDGPDGAPGTGDEVVHPWGEKAVGSK